MHDGPAGPEPAEPSTLGDLPPQVAIRILWPG